MGKCLVALIIGASVKYSVDETSGDINNFAFSRAVQIIMVVLGIGRLLGIGKKRRRLVLFPQN